MGLWIIFPICLSLVSFIGTWSVYGLAFSNNHVCALTDWGNGNYCRANHTDAGCCWVPTISSSGTYPPENSLFTATINAGSFMFFLFCIFHHAHIMERHSSQSMLSKFALVFGVIAAMGAFAAGNCNPFHVSLLHYLGAAISFMCACFYTAILTVLTGKCALSGYEKVLYPLRIISTVIQVIVTVIYTVLFAQSEYFYIHLSAVFEWMLSMNLELFELSYAVEFFFFSSYMLSNLLNKQDEVKPLIMTMS
ncbi:transmembrane protein 150A [Maylandia zebra]|uniref:Si:dkey-228d14.5 n=2 Tax=Haplochromini TaxID=319058 RepID=A0A3Q2W7E1_HAPBU|nr:transmembrane protein 150A [Haplochromis burtoni]XP_026046228.1 transmembrane protein 150A-like [Astatotilapia calliptera]XP_026046229.1 transmembrane protein 150A-like [Astatotilapia calliptera]